MTSREVVEEIVEEFHLDTLEEDDIEQARAYLDAGKSESEVTGYMVSWHKQTVQEAECDSKAAAWFEDAAYGGRNE